MREGKTRDIIPRPMLIAVGVALLAATGTAGVARLSGGGAVEVAPAPEVASRELRFEDRPDRGVDVRDAQSGELVDVVPPKSGGFLRGVMRAMVYDYRSGSGHSAEASERAFRLTQWADGRLSLDDEVTHQRIELAAFGSTNREVFARFLKRRSG